MGCHEGCLLRASPKHWSIVAAGMRSWIRGDVAPSIYRVHVFVHLGERAREAEQHHAAVTTRLFRNVVSGAHPRAEVGIKHNIEDQECCAKNNGKANHHVDQNTDKFCERLEDSVGSWDSKKKERHQPALPAVTSGGLRSY